MSTDSRWGIHSQARIKSSSLSMIWTTLNWYLSHTLNFVKCLVSTKGYLKGIGRGAHLTPILECIHPFFSIHIQVGPFYKAIIFLQNTHKIHSIACPQGRAIITVTSQWAWWRLKSPAARLLTQTFIQTDQRKQQSSASQAFVGGIHRWPVIPRTKGQ